MRPTGIIPSLVTQLNPDESLDPPRLKSRRYAAKLLFQFRVTVDGEDGKRRTCEERIIHLQAQSARTALRAAKSRGRTAQYSYRNSDGNPVRFEFIGILDLLHLGPECEEGEVWYEIRDRLLPLERKAKLIPPERELSAIRQEVESV